MRGPEWAGPLREPSTRKRNRMAAKSQRYSWVVCSRFGIEAGFDRKEDAEAEAERRNQADYEEYAKRATVSPRRPGDMGAFWVLRSDAV
jgi:hypothetical protein